MKREFELVDLENAMGKKFGFNITKFEFENLLSSDYAWPKVLHHLYHEPPASQAGMQYYIRRGAVVDEKVIEVFKNKKIRFIPVVMENESSQYRNRLSNFSKEHAKILMGQVFSCVRSWLASTGNLFINRAQQSLFEEKTNFENAVSGVTVLLPDFVTHLLQEVILFIPNLSVLTLYHELIDDVSTYFEPDEESEEHEQIMKHTLEVVICSIILGKECGLDNQRLKQLALASFLHDIGEIIAFEKCRKAVIEKQVNMWNFDMSIKKYASHHPIYGAMLLSDRNGEPARGLSMAVRQTILQHEQYIDGFGPLNSLEYEDTFLKRIGIDKNAVFLGYNRLPTNSVDEDQYDLVSPKIDVTGKKMHRLSMLSQILNIVERYVTYKENTGKTAALQKMLPYAGERFNGPVFEKFINSLVPADALPDGTVLRLKVPDESEICHLNGHSILVLTRNQSKCFILIKDTAGNFITPKIIEKEKLQKNGCQFVIGEWGK